MFINIDVEVEEAEKLLDLIVALKTKMEEYNAPPIPVVKKKETQEPVNEKTPRHRCGTCKYEKSRSVTEPPCSTCDIANGTYDNWEAKEEKE